ncbi:hypothetical protein LINPERPRIM_LOCUS25922, partial [Linum perenne]
MGGKYVLIVRWGGETNFTSNGVEYKGGHVKKIKATRKLSFSEMLELITESIHFDEHEKPAYLTYRMPAYSDHTRAHIPVALSHDDDVEMIYETLQNNPDIEYAEIYVDTITRFEPTTSSDESEDVSTDDSDGDPEVAERQHMPPTEHYTMIGQPMYATTDMPEISDIPYWDPSRDFSKGMIFQTKKDVQATLKQYALQRNFEYMVCDSKKRLLVVKCKNADTFQCKWTVRAAQSKEKDFWSIHTAEMHHACLQSTIVQDHHQLDSSYVASHILHLIQADPTLKISAIQAQITESVGFKISYKKAWHGKQKALAEVYGDWV